METIDYQVTGMTCAHCERAVSGEVAQVAGVDRVEVSATDGVLHVTTGSGVDDAAILSAVDEAGYAAARVYGERSAVDTPSGDGPSLGDSCCSTDSARRDAATMPAGSRNLLGGAGADDLAECIVTKGATVSKAKAEASHRPIEADVSTSPR